MVQKMEYPVLEKGICFLPVWQYGVRFFTICGPQGERVEFSQLLCDGERVSALQKSVDLAAIAACLIDFTPAGQNELGMQLFSRNPGGAPANVLAMYAKLGGKTAFCGKVGTDAFGDFLLASLQKGGVDTSALMRDENVPTTLAFVQLD